MAAPAFDATIFVRPALLTIVLNFLVIAVSLMTMICNVHASGNLTTPPKLYAVPVGTSLPCTPVPDPAAAMSCFNELHISTSTVTGFDVLYTSPSSGNDMLSWTGVTITGRKAYFGQSWASIRCPTGSAHIGAVCTCNTGYQPDPTGKSCVKVPDVLCPVEALTAPPFNDACADALENINSTQAQKDAACGALTPDMQVAVDRFASKLAQTYIVGTQTPIPLVIASQRRNYAYQAHFKEIWDKMEELVPLMKKDPVMQTACAARRAEIAAEKGCDNADVCTSCYPATSTRRSHCLKGQPAPATAAGDTHMNGTAIDVGDDTLIPLHDVLDARNPPQDIQQFLDEPVATGLRWGGNFIKEDPVHFQVPR